VFGAGAGCGWVLKRVGLHGAGGSSATWNSYHRRAEARGIVLPAVDSRSETWDVVAQGGFGADVLYLDRCRVDPARITLAGFSDGASLRAGPGIGAVRGRVNDAAGHRPPPVHGDGSLITRPPTTVRRTVPPRSSAPFRTRNGSTETAVRSARFPTAIAPADASSNPAKAAQLE